MKTVYIVHAFWDDEAKVWCAEGVNFGGLATWGKDIPDLTSKIEVMVPELLEANHELSEQQQDIPIKLLTETAIIAHRNCA